MQGEAADSRRCSSFARPGHRAATVAGASIYLYGVGFRGATAVAPPTEICSCRTERAQTHALGLARHGTCPRGKALGSVLTSGRATELAFPARMVRPWRKL